MQERLWKQAAAVRLCQEAVRFDRSRLKHVETRVTPSFRNEEPVADVVVVSEEAPTVSKRGGKPDSKAAQAAAAAAAAAAAVASKARVVAKAVAEAEAAAAAAAAAKGAAAGGASAMDIGEPFFPHAGHALFTQMWEGGQASLKGIDEPFPVPGCKLKYWTRQKLCRGASL